MADRTVDAEVAAFIEQYLHDPYMTMVIRLCADAFAEGYDHARRRLVHRTMQIPADYLAQLGPRDLRDAWHRFLNENTARSEREAIRALALLGPRVSWPLEQR